MKPSKVKRAEFRFTEKDLNKIRVRAGIYAKGNVTRWVTYAALECPGRFLDKPKRK